MPIDPVCGMEIEMEDAVSGKEYRGTTYYFCSDECREEFDKNPEKFAEKRKSAG